MAGHQAHHALWPCPHLRSGRAGAGPIEHYCPILGQETRSGRAGRVGGGPGRHVRRQHSRPVECCGGAVRGKGSGEEEGTVPEFHEDNHRSSRGRRRETIEKEQHGISGRQSADLGGSGVLRLLLRFPGSEIWQRLLESGATFKSVDRSGQSSAQRSEVDGLSGRDLPGG